MYSRFMLGRRTTFILILLITALGFALRLHILGRDSFWLDETGVALAALQPTWRGMFVIERTHAMAMPFDYVLTRLMGALSASEFVLRFPAATWGTLGLPLLAVLARRAANRPTAVLAAFLMAVAPVFVRFSQELRFYSALVALFLLSSVILMEAFRRKSRAFWVVYVVVTSFGTYFHPYAMFSALGGAIYAILPSRLTGVDRTTRLYFALACVAIGVLFLPGYWAFGSHQDYNYDMLQWGGTIWSNTRQGLNWTTVAGDRPLLAILLDRFNVIFVLVGMAAALLRWKRYPWLLSLLGGLVLSIAAIVLSSYLKGYWYLPRQLLHLGTIAILFTAFGFTQTVDALARLLRAPARGRALATGLGLLAAIVLVGAAAGQALSKYYATPKSLAREAAAALAGAYERNEAIFIVPNYDRQLYSYYLTLPEPFINTEKLFPVNWEQMPGVLPAPGAPVYIIVRGVISAEQRALLESWGFSTFLESRQARDGVYEVLARDPTGG